MTAQTLQAERPWLYRIIMVVASAENRNHQVESGKQLAMDIAAAMIVKGEKSLDMLQCLLVYNIWFVSFLLLFS